ncbi:DUF397 domain-containing protein [Streptomyces sp. NPDC017056]|uniref:DUF397 domain-containing protein n=1 Tax=Streptomyces sp. NPDC017056 TaxID=3364973 RepID=UPI0037902F27
MDLVGRSWRKSTHSGGQGECLEMADGLPAHSPVPIRDSKRPDGPHLLFPAPAWAAFIASVKAARN